MTEYIVIVQQAWMNDSGWGVNFNSDMVRFERRADAIKHGFAAEEHDDFNIGTLRNGRLVAFAWMDKDFGVVDGEPHGGYDLAAIARELGLGVAR